MNIALKNLFGRKSFSWTTLLLLAAGSIPVWLFLAAIQLQQRFS